MFGAGGATGRVYTVITVMPMILIASALLWGVAALLWTRAPSDRESWS